MYLIEALNTDKEVNMADKNIDFHKTMELLLLDMLYVNGRISANTYYKAREALKRKGAA